MAKLATKEVTADQIMRMTDADRMLQEPYLPRRDRLASLMDLIENSTFN